MSRYFKGDRCNQDWQLLESDEAKSRRGRGWSLFRRIVLAKHNLECDRCGISQKILYLQGKALDIHHIVKVREARHLRFEESNCMVLCQPCHDIVEAEAEREKILSGGQVTDEADKIRTNMVDDSMPADTEANKPHAAQNEFQS